MYEDICYNKNYIKEVICRLDFASPIIGLRKSMPKAIFEVVKEHYPIAEPRDIIGTELRINPLNGPVVNQTVSKEWAFLSRDRKNKCTIESDSVVFSITNYSVFEDARSAFVDILGIVMNTNLEYQGKRLGLRYVNDFPLKGNENWIDDKFFAAIAAHKDKNTIKLLTTLEYAVIDKDIKVRLNYGYNNPDYPACIKREEFIIDIDAYTTGILYQDDLVQFIDDMHFEVQKCFETMITNAFRNTAK